MSVSKKGPQPICGERETFMNEAMRREVNEAVSAGERALMSLRAAETELGSARNWGIVDLLGGGFLTDLIKHSKINRAVSYVESAKYDLHRFEKELNDVQMALDLQDEFGGMLTFADFFFDGVIADYLVQSRIGEARRQIANAIQQVESALRRLRGMN